jgi:hypothetical protein
MVYYDTNYQCRYHTDDVFLEEDIVTDPVVPILVSALAGVVSVAIGIILRRLSDRTKTNFVRKDVFPCECPKYLASIPYGLREIEWWGKNIDSQRISPLPGLGHIRA